MVYDDAACGDVDRVSSEPWRRAALLLPFPLLIPQLRPLLLHSKVIMVWVSWVARGRVECEPDESMSESTVGWLVVGRWQADGKNGESDRLVADGEDAGWLGGMGVRTREKVGKGRRAGTRGLEKGTLLERDAAASLINCHSNWPLLLHLSEQL